MRQMLNTLLILLVCALSHAQNKPYLQFTVNDGLPSNNILDIVQHDDGYIWLATDNGISRFDGQEFVNYSVDDGLPTEEIWMFHKDRYGRIWLLNSTNSGYYLYNGEIRNIGLSKNSILAPALYILYSNGIGLRRSGYLEMVEGGIVSTYDYTYDCLQLSHANPSISDLLVYTPGLTQKHTIREYINEFLGPQHLMSIHLFKTNEKKQNHIFLSNKDVLISINNDYLAINNVAKNKKDSTFFNFPITAIRLPKIQDSIIHIDHDHGFIEYNLIKQEITDSYSSQYNIALNRSIRIGHFIVSATSSGMLILYKNLRTVSSPSPKVANFCFTSNQSLIQDNSGSLYTKTPHSNTWNKLDYNPGTEAHVEKAKDQCYILGGNTYYTYNNTHQHFIKKTICEVRDHYTNTQVPEVNPLIVFNSVSDIFHSDSYLFKCGRYTTFKIQEANRDCSIAYRLPIKNIIGLEKYGNVWYVAKPYSILKTDSTFSTFDTLEQFRKKRIKEIFIHDNNLFTLTQEDGLWQITPSVKKLSTSPEGIIQQTVKHHNNLYYYTHRQLCRIHLKNGASICYDLGFHLPELHIKDIDSDGDRIYILTTDGKIHSFTPEDLSVFADTPRLRVTTPSRSIYKSEKDNFHMKDGTFHIMWKMQDLKSLGKHSIKYRLLPYDSSWISTSEKVVQFINLAAGDYILQVQGEGAYNNRTEVLSLNMVIPEKWYKSNWFYLLLIITIIGSSALIIRTLNHRFRRKEREKNVLNEKFAQLELDALRAQMNPHFIFNSLAAIQSFIRQSRKEEADDYLSQFALLIRQFLDQSRSRDIRLEDEIRLLTNYVELENLRFNQEIEFQLNVADKVDTYQKIPSLLLQPFVENAIQHGLFHKEGYKLLRIAIAQNKDIISISIQDNGVGRKESQRINRNNRPHHRSKGLTMLRERIETLNATGEYLISYNIEDTTSPDEAGTIININIQHS